MRLAGIDANTPDPAGGRILRDASGRPTGVFIDNAMDLITTKLPMPSPEKRARQLKKAAEVIAATGLTAVHEAGADNESIDALKRLADAGELPIRVYVMLADDDRLLEQWFASGPLLDYADRITVRAVKMYADGALGSRGAALLAPYSDDHDNEGLMLTTSERLTAVARRARKAGFQVCTHAIGDRGTRVVLDSYEAADVQPRDRFRIEHLQVAAPGDFERLAARGIIASMQPTHATSDMPWAEARLGSERIKGAYAWRTVLHVGAPLAFGSDFPIEQVNPFLGFQAAVHRQDVNGHPPGGWYPSERLSLGETLAGFTSGANYASFTEKVLGDVAPGRKADLTVIEGEGFPPELAKTTVRYTIVGGEIVYDSSTRPRSMSSK
jgi:predicted amidohydrolase YtcJ